MVLSGLSAVLTLLPIIFIWLCVKEIFSIYPDIAFTDELAVYAYLAVGVSIMAMLLYFIALLFTHKAVFRKQKTCDFVLCRI